MKSDTTIAMKLIVEAYSYPTEFLNPSFKNLLQAKGVRHITVNVGDHNRQGLIMKLRISKFSGLFFRSFNKVILSFNLARIPLVVIPLVSSHLYS